MKQRARISVAWKSFHLFNAFFWQGGASGTQQIIIEGPLCEDYYKIREYLYSQFYLL
jgi:hypothetical protein